MDCLICYEKCLHVYRNFNSVCSHRASVPRATAVLINKLLIVINLPRPGEALFSAALLEMLTTLRLVTTFWLIATFRENSITVLVNGRTASGSGIIPLNLPDDSTVHSGAKRGLTAGVVFNVSVCLCASVRVNEPKSGSGDVVL